MNLHRTAYFNIENRSLRFIPTTNSWRVFYIVSRVRNVSIQCNANRCQGKELWVDTKKQASYTCAAESGVKTFIVDSQELRETWETLTSTTIYVRTDSNQILDPDDVSVGKWERCNSGDDLKTVESRAEDEYGEVLVVDAKDWSIIPAENLVAKFQGKSTRVMMCATSAEEGKALLGALEVGVDGIVLCTDDVTEIRQLQSHIAEMQKSVSAVNLDVATVTDVRTLGMGDRVCVDLCARMAPGEGMLVGNFCRALFLVHSECEESAYINSRPFRVNAGPVHAYTWSSRERTVYLCELAAGDEVTVVNAEGIPRTEVVGRCKVEKRPLVLVQARTADGVDNSVILQNAETVKLVGPQRSTSSITLSSSDSSGPRGLEEVCFDCNLSASVKGVQMGRGESRAIPVTSLQPGDEVFVKMTSGDVTWELQ